MKIKRNIHAGYEEWERVPDVMKNGIMKKSLFGKYQYICTSPKGRISLVSFSSRITDNDWKWEIFSYEKLFTDVERFKTKKEAIAKCKEYLD